MLTEYKKVRLKDVAEKSGVSIPTVSRALSGHPQISEYTKKLVKQTSKELGYIVPRRAAINPASNRRNSIVPKRFGFMVIGTKLQDEVHTDLLNNLMMATSARNIRLEIAALEDNGDSEDIAAQVETYSRGLDGVMLMDMVDTSLLKQLYNAKVPNIVIGDILAGVNDAVAVYRYAHVVRPDDMLAGRLATGSLIAAGHKKVGFICEYMLEGLSFDRWYSGYWLAYRDTGIFPKPEWLHIAGKRFVGGKPAAKAILSLSDPPKAYVIPDVRTAESFLQEMHRGGLSLDKSDVVIGGFRRMLRKYGFEGYPNITWDMKELAEVSVDCMLRLSDRFASSGAEIVIPLSMQNMPKPLDKPTQ